MTKFLLVTTAVALVAAGSASAEPRDSVSRDFPIYANGGKPDLTVDPKRMSSQMEIVATAASCASTPC